MDKLQRLLWPVAERLPPELVIRAGSYGRDLHYVINPYVTVLINYLNRHGGAARSWVNETVVRHGLDSATLILATVLVCLLVYCAMSAVCSLLRPFTERGLLPVAFSFLRSLPPFASIIAKKKAELRDDMLKKRAAQSSDQLTALPSRGASAEQVLARLRQRAASDVQANGSESSTLSGAIYMPADGEHRALLDDVYKMFSLTNPLHADAFPSVRQMEAEVVAITAGLLGGGPHGPNPKVCGAMTSGGTESILSAVKASRDYMAAKKGIRQPEMIIGVSAHAAYWKAAEYFKIKLHVVPVGRDFRLSAATVRRHMNPNTAILVASAPGFPHGLMDDVQGIAHLAARAGICCHVDACLGGFCLPFVRRLGGRVPPFDFAVKGVTSMSVDTHKFGQAHKGTSVVLYCCPELRAHQYTRITDWTGGLYISPGLAGSRPGALIATAWASLVHLGEDGLLAATRRIMAARDRLVAGIGLIPQLQVIGEPEMGVVAFRSTDPRVVNIYVLNDWMHARGWHLNALQAPPALHFCFTAMNAGAAPALVAALRQGVEEQLADPAAAVAAARRGSAPMYGMANATPDRGMVGEFLEAYQDAMLVP
ncbi:hypothetical protein PLESTB_001143300 [Pleodorina starrii]|uniref:sphinganine-1-phosphate aldolase n=1 Tax=Pleodorina starrii TaxID=330485 RepID=A0A9W6BRV3_9CHLO|nr:hypothetical protein PLESTM_000561300 [Pleodorina starrii]GLC56765.1 hypothetical protein PLESTB_001143300 [Pleodorina starrii]GLC66920.1 hypothetical protein PLESTF_000490500 [Pleodorina starrii]